jgi:nicotinamide-nucleotide amidase
LRAEILGVGTELLLGQIENSNARWISERLAEIGVDVLHHEVVGDNLERIAEAFGRAIDRSDVVIATGGLGPTQDDITREGLADAIGVELHRDPAIEDQLRRRFAALRREMPASNLRQADVPQGAQTITPVRGSAPGLVLDVDGTRVYALPGVPAEMREMMEGAVLPELSALAGPSGIASRIVRCVGIAESRVAELVDDLFAGSTNPTVAFLAGGGEVKVRLTAKAPTLQAALALIVPVAREVTARLGDVVVSTDDEALEDVVARLLVERSLTLACAESMTGGGLGQRISHAEGASRFFVGSAICYAVEAKVSVLGVARSTIEGPGPVSEACAREMAAGARALFGADLAISVTGAAGPEPHGGADPGTVWVALDAEGAAHARELHAPGDRELVRAWGAVAALDLLRRHLLELPLDPGDSGGSRSERERASGSPPSS